MKNKALYRDWIIAIVFTLVAAVLIGLVLLSSKQKPRKVTSDEPDIDASISYILSQ